VDGFPPITFIFKSHKFVFGDIPGSLQKTPSLGGVKINPNFPKGSGLYGNLFKTEGQKGSLKKTR